MMNGTVLTNGNNHNPLSMTFVLTRMGFPTVMNAVYF